MSEGHGKAAVQAFLDAFNRVDLEAIASSFNFPHIRLNQGKFTIFEARADYLRKSANLKDKLAAEGCTAPRWNNCRSYTPRRKRCT